MASLTIAKRDSIIKAEKNKRFYDVLLKNENKILDELKKLAEKSVPSWVTDEIRASGYLSTSNHFVFEDNEDVEDFLWDLDIKKSLDEHYPRKGYDYVKLVPSKTLNNLIKKRKTIIEEQSDFIRTFRAVLYSYRTSKKLLEAVPELKDHFHNEVQASAIIPVEQIKKVRGFLK